MMGIIKDWTELRSENISKSLCVTHWDHKFHFPVTFGQGAFLLFKIDCRKQSVRIATGAVAVSTIRSGYRSVVLRNYQGTTAPFASLLVHFTWKKDTD